MKDFYYKFSWVGVIILLVGFIAVTPIDAIRQSESTGQFWNAIIVVIAYIIAVIAAMVQSILRIIQVRRTLADIPKRYMIRLDDISSRSAKLIASERARCMDILDKCKPRNKISHAGLMNPEISGGMLNVPYEDVIIASTVRLEQRATQLSPFFKRPIGMPLREYLLLLNSYKLIDNTDMLFKFIRMYEKARFSGQPLEEDFFNDFVATCIGILFSIKAMDSNNFSRAQESPNLAAYDTSNLSRSSTVDRMSGSRGHSQENSQAFVTPFHPYSSSAVARPPITRFNSALSPTHSHSQSHTLSPLSTYVSIARTDSRASSDVQSDSSVIIRHID